MAKSNRPMSSLAVGKLPGPKTVPVVKINDGNVDPRKGAAKRPTPIKTHDGMYHIRNGQMIRTTNTSTITEHPVEADAITTPTLGKERGPAPAAPGMRSRISPLDPSARLPASIIRG